jgi:DNA-binding CsgD family transcriptional regulator
MLIYVRKTTRKWIPRPSHVHPVSRGLSVTGNRERDGRPRGAVEGLQCPCGTAGIAARILASAAGRKPAERLGSLTDRERDVLAMIAEGSSNAQIARALGLSLKTVQNYGSRVLDKLQVTDRTQAAIRAHGDRAGSPGSPDGDSRPR